MAPMILSSKFIQEILISGFTVIAAIFLNSFFRSHIKGPKTLESTRSGKVYITIFKNTVTLIIFYFVLHIVVMVLGINVTPLLASVGIVGVIVGIGAQSIFRDLIAGFFLISQSNIAIGDYVNLGSGIEGTVRSIGLKNISLISPNGALIVMPNGNVNNIINLSYGKANTFIDIPIKAKLPIDEVVGMFKEILKQFINENTYTLYKESRVIGIKSVDGNGITIRTLLVTPYSLRTIIEPEFYYRVTKEFEKRKILLI